MECLTSTAAVAQPGPVPVECIQSHGDGVLLSLGGPVGRDSDETAEIGSLRRVVPSCLAEDEVGHGAQLRGTAQPSLPTTATGSANLSFTGRLGGTAISGDVPLPVDTTDHVTGNIKVG
jgi:hypothetical protein